MNNNRTIQKIETKTNIQRVVVRRMSYCVLHCPHHTVNSSPSVYSESAPTFLGRSLDLFQWCVVSSDSDMALLHLALASKVQSCPQNPQSKANCEDLIHCTQRSTFTSSYLVTQPLVFYFGFDSTSAYRMPSGSVPCPDKSR